MNLQNAQTMKACGQTETLAITNSIIDKVIAETRFIVGKINQYYADKKLSLTISKLSARHLQDIGLDDPQTQIKLFDVNLNSAASHRQMMETRSSFR